MKICSFDVGIKNLAYCIIHKDNDDFKIIDWNIINISNQEKKEKYTCSYIEGKKKCNAYCKHYYINGYSKNGLCKNHILNIKNIISDNNFTILSECTDNICEYKNKKTCNSVAKYLKQEIKYCEKHYENELKILLKNNKLIKIKNLNINYESNFILAKNMYNKLNNIKLLLDVDEILIENQPSLKNPIMKNIASLLYGYFILKGVIDGKISTVKFISPLNKLKINKDIAKEVLDNYVKKADIKKETKKLGIVFTKIILNNKQDQLKLLDNHSKIDDMCDSFLQGYHYLYKNIGFNFDTELYKKMTNVKKIVIE